jgi:hypothetical protein
MSELYIRVKKDGFIYDFNEILAKNPDCEVISAEEAFPERFVPAHVADRVKPVGRAKSKGALDLSTADIPEEPAYTAPELAAEVSRGL